MGFAFADRNFNNSAWSKNFSGRISKSLAIFAKKTGGNYLVEKGFRRILIFFHLARHSFIIHW